jgi:hypothetical protein
MVREVNQKNVLSSKELISMRPKDRERYVQNIMLNAIDKPEGMTQAEIVQKTALTRTTITKYLEKLVALQQIVKEARTVGKVSVYVYKRIISVEGKKNSRIEFSGDSRYSFFPIDVEDDHWLCVQQIEVDMYGAEKVKGAVTISFDDFERFLKELHAYGAKVIGK